MPVKFPIARDDPVNEADRSMSESVNWQSNLVRADGLIGSFPNIVKGFSARVVFQGRHPEGDDLLNRPVRVATSRPS